MSVGIWEVTLTALGGVTTEPCPPLDRPEGSAANRTGHVRDTERLWVGEGRRSYRVASFLGFFSLLA